MRNNGVNIVFGQIGCDSKWQARIERLRIEHRAYK